MRLSRLMSTRPSTFESSVGRLRLRGTALDEVAGHEMAAWRDTRDSAFTSFVDLTGFDEGAPNTACDTLYFQGTDGSGAGVFVTQ